MKQKDLDLFMQEIAKDCYLKLIFENNAIKENVKYEEMAKESIQIAKVFVATFVECQKEKTLKSSSFIKSTNGNLNKEII